MGGACSDRARDTSIGGKCASASRSERQGGANAPTSMHDSPQCTAVGRLRRPQIAWSWSQGMPEPCCATHMDLAATASGDLARNSPSRTGVDPSGRRLFSWTLSARITSGSAGALHPIGGTRRTIRIRPDSLRKLRISPEGFRHSGPGSSAYNARDACAVLRPQLSRERGLTGAPV
jgi:hypothetical protein